MTKIPEEQMVRLLREMIKQTEADRLIWSALDGYLDEYGAQTERFNYFVGSEHGDAHDPYRYQIWRRGGASSVPLDEAYSSSELGSGRLVKQLYMVVRSRADGLANIVDDVIADIQNEPPF